MMTDHERPGALGIKADWDNIMILDLLERPEQIQLVVNAADLKEMFLTWVDEWQNKQQKPEEKYLSREEVCDLLSVTKPTLWRWAKRGYLIPVKVGNRPLYRQSDIEKLMTKEG